MKPSRPDGTPSDALSSPAALRAAAKLAPPPPDLPPTARTLWWIAAGDWAAAHAIAQDLDDRAGAWLHAHLHRIEGDHDNADYWYARAGRPPMRGDLDAEWEQLARALLGA